MISSRNLVKFINPPEYLCVLIAYTVAADVLPIFEEKYPKDLRPRKAVEVAKMYLEGYAVVAADVDAAIYAAADAADAAYAANAAYYAYVAVANVANAAYAAAYVAYYAAVADVSYTVAYATYAADYAVSVSSEEHIFNLILSLIPQMIDYAVENQIKLFTGSGDFSEIFEMLIDEQKKLVIFNMDVFRNWK